MYIAIDGDSVGKRLEKFILENNKVELKAFSQSISNIILNLQQIILNNNGNIYMCGGDNIFSSCSEECAQIVFDFIRKENEKNEILFSVAIGESMQDTYMALNYAKSSHQHFVKALRKDSNLEFVLE